jgi:hypothetical protein
MLKPEHGQRRNAGERRTLARSAAPRRSGEIKDSDQAVARAREEAEKRWTEVAQRATRLKRQSEIYETKSNAQNAKENAQPDNLGESSYKISRPKGQCQRIVFT